MGGFGSGRRRDPRHDQHVEFAWANRERMTQAQIARALGVSGSQAARLQQEGAEATADDDHTDGDRCRCGLRLPCSDCWTNVREFVARLRRPEAR